MTTVGIDYALRNIHCALHDGRSLLGTSAHAIGSDVAAHAAVLTRLVMEWRTEHGPCAVYLERPWVGHFRNKRGETKPNMQTAIELSLLVGGIAHLCAAAGHTVTLVAPDAWRAGVMLPPASQRREDKKAAARRTVLIEHGLTVDDDTADSILIATWGAAQERRGALVGAAGG